MPLQLLLKGTKINIQDHGMAKNDSAVNMNELQYQANLEMILQFWYFLGTTDKETPKFACNKLEKGLCSVYDLYIQSVFYFAFPFILSYCL